jgi:hypothetical protein
MPESVTNFLHTQRFGQRPVDFQHAKAALLLVAAGNEQLRLAFVESEALQMRFERQFEACAHAIDRGREGRRGFGHHNRGRTGG